MTEQFQISGNLVKLLQFVKWNKKTPVGLSRYIPKSPEYFIGTTVKLFLASILIHGPCPPI